MFKFFKNNGNTSRGLFEISKSERSEFCEHIIDSSTPKGDFYFLVVLSTFIVSLGLIGNNAILVIGGMLVTPLLSPILAISLGMVIMNVKVIFRSIRIFFIAFVVAAFVSFLIGSFFDFDLDRIDLIKIMVPSLYVFMVAFVAGLAASFTWAKKELNNTLPGIAITVTLIPPLTAVGLSLSVRNLDVFRNVLNVLLLNVVGIIFGSLFILILMKFYKSKKKVLAEVKEEEKELNNN